MRMRAMGSSMVLGFSRFTVPPGDILADSIEQLVLAERFGQVLVRADDAALCLVEQAVLAGEHNNRRLLKEELFLISAQVW